MRRWLVISTAALFGCVGETARFVQLPASDGVEQVAIVVVEEASRLTANVVDLDGPEAVVRSDIEPDAIVHMFTYERLPVPAGPLELAALGECRTLGVAGYTRAFQIVEDRIDAVGQVAERLRDLRFVAPCPCVTFDVTEIAVTGQAMWDAHRLDDDRAVLVSTSGIEEISVSSATSFLAVPTMEVRSVHVTPTGRRFYGDSEGRLLEQTQTTTLALVADAGDSTGLRYLTGADEDPSELLMMHDSGVVRTFRGNAFTEILDDALVGQTDTIGNLVAITPGRALISQSSGSGLHVWDRDARDPVFYVEWDTIVLGPIKSVAWFDGFGGRMSTRATYVLESQDGRRWSRVETSLDLVAGGVNAFGSFRDTVVEVHEHGVLQLLAVDGVYCPVQDLETRVRPQFVVSVGDRLLIVGNTPEGLPTVALLLEPRPAP